MNHFEKISVIKQVIQVTKSHNYPLIPCLWQFYKYAGYGKYSPREIFMMDLLNPAISYEENKGMISAESFLRYQVKINPSSHVYLTEDKVAFHNFCVKNNLLVPELIASIDTNHISSWGNDTPIISEKDFLDGLKKYPYDIICKPTHGTHGKQVTNLHFVNTKHILTDYPDISLAEFIHAIFVEPAGTYIFQKKLYSHRDIVKFTSNSMLQTMRIETYLDENNQSHILDQCIKFPVKGSVVDNFVFGTSNNRICRIDKNGFLISTLVNCDKKHHLVKHNYVIDSNGRVSSFQIPLWEECRKLVLDAQSLFSPLKTIGWDVGVTNDGPILIEGNTYWDPHMRQEETMKKILHTLSVPIEQKFSINRYKETDTDQLLSMQT